MQSCASLASPILLVEEHVGTSVATLRHTCHAEATAKADDAATPRATTRVMRGISIALPASAHTRKLYFGICPRNPRGLCRFALRPVSGFSENQRSSPYNSMAFSRRIWWTRRVATSSLSMSRATFLANTSAIQSRAMERWATAISGQPTSEPNPRIR